MKEWEDFFITASQYYVAGRYAAFAAFIPVVGNLFHHALEMYLKGGLSKKGHSLNALRAFKHDLLKIWDEFKRTFNDPSLNSFDNTINLLHDFEDLRYPQSNPPSVIEVLIDIVKQPPIPGHRSTHSLCVEDLDELVGQIFKTASVNPTAFLSSRYQNAEAKEYLTKENRVRSLIV